jgi:hypothetical protein
VSEAYELEDVWLNAIAKLPDTKPLAELLRDFSTPIPPGVRDLLAELLPWHSRYLRFPTGV